MHTAIIISAYLAMLFLPCACAQWGDVLTAEWWSYRRAVRRRALNPAMVFDPVFAAVRAERVSIEIETLTSAAFVELSAFGSSQRMPRLFTQDQLAFQRASDRVSARLSALSESYRRAHGAEPLPVEATTPPVHEAGAPEATPLPMGQNAISTLLIHTPTPEELDALYALEAPEPAALLAEPPGLNQSEETTDTSSESIAA